MKVVYKESDKTKEQIMEDIKFYLNSLNERIMDSKEIYEWKASQQAKINFIFNLLEDL